MKSTQNNKEKDSVLTPIKEVSKIEGDLYYGQGNRAWNTIRLKADILKKFPQLKKREAKFGYKMIVPQSKEEAKRLIIEFSEFEDRVPIFLFFCKKEVSESN